MMNGSVKEKKVIMPESDISFRRRSSQIRGRDSNKYTRYADVLTERGESRTSVESDGFWACAAICRRLSRRRTANTSHGLHSDDEGNQRHP